MKRGWENVLIVSETDSRCGICGKFLPLPNDLDGIDKRDIQNSIHNENPEEWHSREKDHHGNLHCSVCGKKL